MGNKIYVAEKPSVGRELAALLNKVKEEKFHIVCENGVIVTWLSGHILELLDPADYDDKYKTWELGNLPIFPSPFKLRPTKDKIKMGKKEDNSYKRNQLKNLAELLKTADTVVIASDPDAEGELLAREVIDYLGFKGNLTRILPTTLEKNELTQIINDEFPASRTELIGLAGLARSHIDWLIGINITRGLTAFNRSKINSPLNTGRVQAAITKVLHMNYLARENFSPRETFSIFLDAVIDGRHIKLKYKPTDEQSEILNQKLPSYNADIARNLVRDLITKMSGKSGIVSSCKKAEKKTAPPLGYRLSDIQIEMSNKFGYSAADTTQNVQTMYESKILSYPRTDNEYMPEEAHSYAHEVLEHLSFITEPLGDRINPSKKTAIWNTKKIENHHALMPTKLQANRNALTEAQRNIYDAICRRYVMQFMPDHTFYKTDIEVEIDGMKFKAGGKSIIDNGWRDLIGGIKVSDEEDEDDEDDDQSIPIVEAGTHVSDCKPNIKEGKTTKPALYTEATLMSTMVNAYRIIENKELSKIMKDRKQSIGKQSTLATIIDLMKYNNMFTVEKKSLVLTPKGLMMAEIIPPALSNLELTAKLEMAFVGIERSEITYDQLLMQYKTSVNTMLDEIRDGKCALKTSLVKQTPCPSCKTGNVVRRLRKSDKTPFWICDSCGEFFADNKNRPLPKIAPIPCLKSTCEGKLHQKKRKSDGTLFWVCDVCGGFYDNKANKPVPKVEPTPCLKSTCEGKLHQKKRKSDGKLFWVCDTCGDFYGNNKENRPVARSEKANCPICGTDKAVFKFEFKSAKGKFAHMCGNCKAVFPDVGGNLLNHGFKCSCGTNLNYLYSAKGKKWIWSCPKDGCKKFYNNKDGAIEPIF
ncbi:DNA topoisomerase [Photobacterium damselae]|uniref:DNA topoisomerase n=1 Tax=Photobacterium damselae TaxID=38293 RepID=UPI004067A78D